MFPSLFNSSSLSSLFFSFPLKLALCSDLLLESKLTFSSFVAYKHLLVLFLNYCVLFFPHLERDSPASPWVLAWSFTFSFLMGLLGYYQYFPSFFYFPFTCLHSQGNTDQLLENFPLRKYDFRSACLLSWLWLCLFHNSITYMSIHTAYNVISAEHISTHEGSSYSASVYVLQKFWCY